MSKPATAECSVLAHKYNDLASCPACQNLVSIEADIDKLNSEVYQRLEDRARWYRDGCKGLEDREAYYASGDCARDAASDLFAALSEIRVLDRVIKMMRRPRVSDNEAEAQQHPRYPFDQNPERR